MREIDGKQMLWLIALCIIASATALFVDETVFAIQNVKLEYRQNYFVWMASSLFFAFCGQACIQFISPQAQGSGIPQLKAIMAGVNLPNMLSFKTYVSKVLGMVFMLSSGMSMGKEGPFVHISGCIANCLPYQSIQTNKTLKHQFLTAAIAVGVTCTFGAPIGGVLFAIEVSTSSFTVSNLWKSFFASTVTVLCFKSVGLLANAAVFSADASYFYSGVAPVGINHEQPFFIGLGLICGIFGTKYIQFQKTVNLWKKRNMSNKFISNNWCYTLTSVFIMGNFIYATKIMQTGDKAIIRSMIDIDQNIASRNLTEATLNSYVSDHFHFGQSTMIDQEQWVLYDGFMVMFLIQKFLFTAWILSCPTPGGIFTPTFCMGAVLGQLYVSCLIKFLEFFEMSSVIQYRGVYSILGAAAVTSSVTRTVSVAMIVLELNGHLSHACPLMVCVLSSYAMSEYLMPVSFFEMLSELGGLDAKISQKGKIIIKDFLDVYPDYKKVQCLSLSDGTLEEMLEIIKKNTAPPSKNLSDGLPNLQFLYIPVVDSHRNMNLLYMVQLDDLVKAYSEYVGPIDSNSSLVKEKENLDIKLSKIGTNSMINEPLLGGVTIQNMDAHLSSVNTLRFLIMSIRHIAPPVLYSQAPLTYLSPGTAGNFYEGEKEMISAQDPSMIIYWILESEKSQDLHPNKMMNSNISEDLYGCRLVGFIPCSDIFGVDLILDKYTEALAKQKQTREKKEHVRRESFIVQLSARNEPKDLGDKDDDYQRMNNTQALKTHSRLISLQTPDQEPENLNANIGLEMSSIDKSNLSLMGYQNSQPLRVTTKGEEQQKKQIQLDAREKDLDDKEQQVLKLMEQLKKQSLNSINQKKGFQLNLYDDGRHSESNDGI